MSELEHGGYGIKHPDEDKERMGEWLVRGPEGAVTFLVYPQDKTDQGETACCFGIHSRRKFATMPKLGKCDVLQEGKCYEEIKLQGAHQLWVFSEHGRNKKLIYEALESWYSATFGKKNE